MGPLPHMCGSSIVSHWNGRAMRAPTKNRCEIRSTTRASPRSAQDDARGRTQHIPTAFLPVEIPSVFAVLPSSSFLPVEIPSVFAVLFEAAKAKSALCSNRVCLAKNAKAFFACNTRPPTGYVRAEPLRTFSLVRFFDVCQRNEQQFNYSQKPIFAQSKILSPREKFTVFGVAFSPQICENKATDPHRHPHHPPRRVT